MPMHVLKRKERWLKALEYIHEDVRQRCVMLPWLFSLFMDGAVKELKARFGKVGMEV